MATGTNVGLDFTYAAAGDLSAAQYRFVVHTATKKTVDRAAATIGEAVIGVLQNDPGAAGRESAVRTGGRSPVLCGGSFNPGDFVTTDSQGRAVKYTKATVFTGTPYIVSGTPVLGVAEEAGVSGEQHDIVISFRGLHG